MKRAWQNWSVSIIDSGQRLRIAWWSPWPPSRSGVAEYSVALLSRLQHLADVTVFVDDALFKQVTLALPHAPIFPAGAFLTRHAARPFDAAVFHLGNQAGHAYMADALLNAPCRRIAVLHDGSLYHLYQGISHWRLLREIIAEESWPAAWRAWRRMRLPGSDSYSHPLLRRICRASDVIIAHSDFLARRLRLAAPEKPVVVVPHGTNDFQDDGGALQAQARRALDLPPDAILFGVFGHITAAKRVERAIEAFVASNPPNSALYIAGELSPLAPETVRRWADDPIRCAQHRIRFEAAYHARLYLLLAMQAMNAGVALRFPTAGESSGVLSDLLSMGKPAIVSDVGAFHELSDECVIKTPVGEGEMEALSKAFWMLATQPGLRADMSRAARRYSAQHTWQIVAEAYLRAILNSR